MRCVAWLAVFVGLGLTSLTWAQEESPLDKLEGQLASPKPFEPGWIGLTADEVEGSITALAVSAQGPAEKAGIRVGDRIASVAGREVNNLDDFADAVKSLPAGANIEVKILRNERQSTLLVELAPRPATASEPTATPETVATPPAASDPAARPKLGIHILPLTPELRQSEGLFAREGAYVAQVAPGSPAARAGIPMGVVIVRMNQRNIVQPSDVLEEMQQIRSGGVVTVDYDIRGRIERRTIPLTVAAVPPAASHLDELEALLKPPPEKSAAAATPALPAPPPVDATAALQAKVEALEAELLRLQQRVRDLEQGLARPAEP